MPNPVEIIAWEPAQLGPVINFNPDDFRRTIFTDGTPVIWSKVVLCPCSVIDTDPTIPAEERSAAEKIRTGVHNEDCPKCKGKGRFYVQPQLIKALVQGASRDKALYQIYGALTKGMASLSLLPEHAPCELDRYELTNTVVTLQETRMRRYDVEQPFYPIASVIQDTGAPGNPKVRIPTAINGVIIFRADSTGRIVSDALVEGVHFEVTEAGWIKWLGVGTRSRGFAVFQYGEGNVTFPTDFVIPRGTIFPALASTGEPLPGPEDENPWFFEEYTTPYDILILPYGNAEAFGYLESVRSGARTNMPANTRATFTLPSGVKIFFDVDSGTSGGTDGDNVDALPAVRDFYTIRYKAHPALVVHAIPHIHRDTYIRKPGGDSDSRVFRQQPVFASCWMEHLGDPDERLPKGENADVGGSISG